MIPDYQSLMLPVLLCLKDGKDHKKQSLIDQLAAQLQVSLEERAQLLPSRTQRTFDNRVGWAITYLKKAKLVSAQQRATFRISDRGSQVLSASPQGSTTPTLGSSGSSGVQDQTGCERGPSSSQSASVTIANTGRSPPPSLPGDPRRARRRTCSTGSGSARQPSSNGWS